MTEDEWRRCRAPNVLFGVVRSRPGSLARSWLLFNVACCRAAGRHLGYEPHLRYLDHVERWLDRPNRRGRGRLADGFHLTPRLTVVRPAHPEDRAHVYAAGAVQRAHELNNAAAYLAALARTTGTPRGTRVEARRRVTAEQAGWVRDIFGNPFRPAALDPAWLTTDVLNLAAGIDADRAFDRLPILADALQDASCEDADILDHCRGTGPHVRGCWVIDLILGRE